LYLNAKPSIGPVLVGSNALPILARDNPTSVVSLEKRRVLARFILAMCDTFRQPSLPP
jgi:hypothetical protein